MNLEKESKLNSLKIDIHPGSRAESRSVRSALARHHRSTSMAIAWQMADDHILAAEGSHEYSRRLKP